MKKAIVFLFVILYLCKWTHTQSTCADGTYISGGGIDPDKGKCTVCLPVCKTCTDGNACTKFIDTLKGVDSSNSIRCGTGNIARVTPTIAGYNSALDSCSYCKEGCSKCVIDYDRCSQCKSGWDYDAKNYTCIRATTGLSATVLALTVLTLLTLVITCICACKL